MFTHLLFWSTMRNTKIAAIWRKHVAIINIVKGNAQLAGPTVFPIVKCNGVRKHVGWVDSSLVLDNCTTDYTQYDIL